MRGGAGRSPCSPIRKREMAKLVRTKIEVEGRVEEEYALVDESKTTPWDIEEELRVVGKPIPRVDGGTRAADPLGEPQASLRIAQNRGDPGRPAHWCARHPLRNWAGRTDSQRIHGAGIGLRTVRLSPDSQCRDARRESLSGLALPVLSRGVLLLSQRRRDLLYA